MVKHDLRPRYQSGFRFEVRGVGCQERTLIPTKPKAPQTPKNPKPQQNLRLSPNPRALESSTLESSSLEFQP